MKTSESWGSFFSNIIGYFNNLADFHRLFKTGKSGRFAGVPGTGFRETVPV